MVDIEIKQERDGYDTQIFQFNSVHSLIKYKFEGKGREVKSKKGDE